MLVERSDVALFPDLSDENRARSDDSVTISSDSLPPLARVYPAHKRKVSLPGKGEPSAGCGDPFHMYCPGCGWEGSVEQHCLRRECPNCSGNWASAETAIVFGRLHDTRKRLKKPLRIGRFVVSFDDNSKYANKEGEIDVREFGRARKRVYEVCRWAGISGGVVVFHPYRETIPRSGVYDKWSPHFHCTGVAGWVHSGATVRGEFGDVFFKTSQRRATWKRVAYDFDHCGIIKGIHAAVWWGEASYTKGTGPLEEEAKLPYGRNCPKCNFALEPVLTFDTTAWPFEPMYYAAGRASDG